MRTLMICTEKYPVPAVRGEAVPSYLQGIAPHLADRHDVTVLGTTDRSLPYEAQVGSVKYARVRGGRLDRYTESISNFLAEHRFDLIHLFNRPQLVAPVRRAAPDARIILSVHNDGFSPNKITAAEAEAAIKQTAALLTVSDHAGRAIANRYASAAPKLRTIYPGVDVDRFPPRWSTKGRQMGYAIRKAYDLRDGAVILFPGRLSPEEGADVLMRAMRKVAEHHEDATLVLLGSKWYGKTESTEYLPSVRALAARTPLRVICTGDLPTDLIPGWYAAADLFVCATQRDVPLGRAHLEAMAAGLPIITTAKGGNPEVVEGLNNGVVLNGAADPNAFAKAINYLIDDTDLRQNMGRQGRRLAERRFTWERVASEIAAVWESQF